MSGADQPSSNRAQSPAAFIAWQLAESLLLDKVITRRVSHLRARSCRSCSGPNAGEEDVTDEGGLQPGSTAAQVGRAQPAARSPFPGASVDGEGRPRTRAAALSCWRGVAPASGAVEGPAEIREIKRRAPRPSTSKAGTEGWLDKRLGRHRVGSDRLRRTELDHYARPVTRAGSCTAAGAARSRLCLCSTGIS